LFSHPPGNFSAPFFALFGCFNLGPASLFLFSPTTPRLSSSAFAWREDFCDIPPSWSYLRNFFCFSGSPSRIWLGLLLKGSVDSKVWLNCPPNPPKTAPHLEAAWTHFLDFLEHSLHPHPSEPEGGLILWSLFTAQAPFPFLFSPRDSLAFPTCVQPPSLFGSSWFCEPLPSPPKFFPRSPPPLFFLFLLDFFPFNGLFFPRVFLGPIVPGKGHVFGPPAASQQGFFLLLHVFCGPSVPGKTCLLSLFPRLPQCEFFFFFPFPPKRLKAPLTR